MTKTSVHWTERDLDDVLLAFAQGFVIGNGRILSSEWFVDTSRKKVAFKLIVEEHIKVSKNRGRYDRA